MVSEKMRWVIVFFGAVFLVSSVGVAATLQTDCSKVLPIKKASASSVKDLKIALVPFRMDGLTTRFEFLAKIEAAVRQAAQNKAGLVVFPELYISDMVEAAEKTEPFLTQMKKVAVEHTPKVMESLKSLAKKHKIAILGGTLPRQEGDKIFNTAVLVLADGRVHLQNKIFLTPDEKDWAFSPGEELNVIEAPWGRTVILTCYDVEFAQISQKLSSLAPELILVPSMTDNIEGFRRVRWSAQARAVEHRAYVAHVGTIGEADPSWPNYGQASVLTPSEKNFPGVLAEGAVNSSEILYANLDFKKLREARHKVGIYPACEEKARVQDISVKVQK